MSAPPRERLHADAAAVLRGLPAMGRLMITANNAGATHERIGIVERTEEQGDWIVCSGAEHDSRIAIGDVAELVIDRSSVMKDKVFPHLELLNGGGTTIASVVGFEGLEPFEAALGGFRDREALASPEPPARPAPAELRDDDAAAVLLTPLIGQEAEIGLQRPGFIQRWRGTIEAVKPAMGFINVMRGDFHLHLRAGAIAGWRDRDGASWALDPQGGEIGLYVRTLR
jgi:putative heme degradation protein